MSYVTTANSRPSLAQVLANRRPAPLLMVGGTPLNFRRACPCKCRKRGAGLGQDTTDVGSLPLDVSAPIDLSGAGAVDSSQLMDVLSSFNNLQATPVQTNLQSIGAAQAATAPILPASAGVPSSATSGGGGVLSNILKYLPSAVASGTQIAAAAKGTPSSFITGTSVGNATVTQPSWFSQSTSLGGAAVPNWLLLSGGALAAIVLVKAMTRKKK
jgi:hypothetical protein